MGFKRPQVRLLSLGPRRRDILWDIPSFFVYRILAGNLWNLRPLVYCIFGRRPQARECAAAAGSTPVTRTLLSENRICGFLRQRSPGLRAGFAAFLRKSRRVMEFFPGACPWKNHFIKAASTQVRRGRRFESCHSDQTMIIRTTLSKWVMCSDLSFLLRMFYKTGGNALLHSLSFSPVVINQHA